MSPMSELSVDCCVPDPDHRKPRKPGRQGDDERQLGGEEKGRGEKASYFPLFPSFRFPVSLFMKRIHSTTEFKHFAVSDRSTHRNATSVGAPDEQIETLMMVQVHCRPPDAVQYSDQKGAER